MKFYCSFLGLVTLKLLICCLHNSSGGFPSSKNLLMTSKHRTTFQSYSMKRLKRSPQSPTAAGKAKKKWEWVSIVPLVNPETKKLAQPKTGSNVSLANAASGASRSATEFPVKSERSLTRDDEPTYNKILRKDNPQFNVGGRQVIATSKSLSGNSKATASNKLGTLAVAKAETAKYGGIASSKSFSTGGSGNGEGKAAVANSLSSHGSRSIAQAGSDAVVPESEDGDDKNENDSIEEDAAAEKLKEKTDGVFSKIDHVLNV